METFWAGSIDPSNHVIVEAAHHVPLWVKLLPVVMAVGGIAVAYWFYIRAPGLPKKVSAALRPVDVLFARKWFFDEIYNAIFVVPARALGWLFWKGGDGLIIDGLGPDGLSKATRRLAKRASQLQTGYVYHYAFAMLIGVVTFVSLYVYLGWF